jgi:hypothetical protein
LIAAAMSAAPNDRRSEASTRGAVTWATKASQLSVKVLKNAADSGIRTIRLR